MEGGNESFIARPVWVACERPFCVSGGSYGVGEVRCQSGSSWSNRAPWRRKKIGEGMEDEWESGDDGGDIEFFAFLRVVDLGL